MPRVSFEHIVKRFGAITVLDGLNLAVDDGDFLVLLGPSGCGKTTLLNLLAGLSDVTSGRIMIGERDVTDLDPKDRRLAMVFQSYALYPTKTVRGNLRFGLSASKLPKEEIDKRIAWAADMLQIGPLMDRRPAQLSGGQRQRVAIGRALVKHADVLLFDEPLSNLDAKLRTEMRLEIKKLHEELNPTVVYVTHDQIEAMTMATRIAIMNGGKIEQFGTPDDVYERPANLFVAGFIGSPSMNLLPATVETGGRARLADGSLLDMSGYVFDTTPPAGAELVVGLRPEHFSLVANVDPACRLDLEIRHIERTGSDAMLSLAFGDRRVVVRATPTETSRLKSGDKIAVTFPKDRLNLFDAGSGRRI
ncbi:ABC transporter ATP-binding protein [Pleomorphomonas oryzae]|uniref:ABC transporter ATP-binding protein n=1 Tax=Pleomorphomonas oryzae TaxID=261934 RepID=UPI0003FBD86C|nr:sn-glycerol-3-phosphate ABC transporter ATP-binding protein UgpC [Pleomorphomonas oryzae]